MGVRKAPAKKDVVHVKVKDTPKTDVIRSKETTPSTLSLSAAAVARKKKDSASSAFKYSHAELVAMYTEDACAPQVAGIPQEVRRKVANSFTTLTWQPINDTKRPVHTVAKQDDTQHTPAPKESQRGEGKPKLMPSPTPKAGYTTPTETSLARCAEDDYMLEEIYRDVVMSEEKKKGSASPKPPPPPLEEIFDEDDDGDLCAADVSSIMATPVKEVLPNPPELLPAGSVPEMTPVVRPSPPLSHCTPAQQRGAMTPQVSPAPMSASRSVHSAATPAKATPSPASAAMLAAHVAQQQRAASVGGYSANVVGGGGGGGRASAMTPPGVSLPQRGPSVSPLPMSAHIGVGASPKPTPAATIAARQMMYQGYGGGKK